MKKQSKTVDVHYRITPETKQIIEDIAHLLGWSQTEVIEQALAEYSEQFQVYLDTPGDSWPG